MPGNISREEAGTPTSKLRSMAQTSTFYVDVSMCTERRAATSGSCGPWFCCANDEGLWLRLLMYVTFVVLVVI